MGYQPSRPYPSKKEFKAAVEVGRASVYSTSPFGNDHSGPVADLPVGTYTVAGPTDFHKWYATVKVTTKDGQKIIKVS